MHLVYSFEGKNVDSLYMGRKLSCAMANSKGNAMGDCTSLNWIFRFSLVTLRKFKTAAPDGSQSPPCSCMEPESFAPSWRGAQSCNVNFREGSSHEPAELTTSCPHTSHVSCGRCKKLLIKSVHGIVCQPSCAQSAKVNLECCKEAYS